MPTCSCPYCGRTGIPFELHESQTVFTCRDCLGQFTPLGGPSAPCVPDDPKFRFLCPHCSASIKAQDSWRGKRVACPKCRQALTVPYAELPMLPELPPVVIPPPVVEVQSLVVQPSVFDFNEAQPFQFSTSPQVQAQRAINPIPAPPAPNPQDTRGGMGGLLILLGALITAGFWLFYDVSVESGYGRVVNLHKMHERQTGIIVGIGMMILGAILHLKSPSTTLQSGAPIAASPPATSSLGQVIQVAFWICFGILAIGFASVVMQSAQR